MLCLQQKVSQSILVNPRLYLASSLYSRRWYCKNIDNPYAKVKESAAKMEKASEKPETSTASIKSFGEIPGVKSSREFLYYVQQSHQVADRPHREVLFEMIFNQFGDLARCDQRSTPNLLLGNADHIEEVAKKALPRPKYHFFYNEFYKKYDIPIGLGGERQEHLLEPIEKCCTNPNFIKEQIEPFRKISRQYADAIEESRDQYTQVAPHIMITAFMWNFECLASTVFRIEGGVFAEDEETTPNYAREYLEIQKRISKAEGALVRNPLSRILPTLSWYRFSKGLQSLYELIGKWMAKDDANEKKNSLHQFLKSYRYADNSHIENKELAVVLSNILTSATARVHMTSLWLFYDLATNQDAQEKVYQEMKKNSFNLRDSPYLFAAIKESMRLHPIHDSYALISPEGGMILNHFEIPEKVGLTAVSSNTALNAAYFEDPLTFKPERWLDSSKTSHSHAFSPYGIGRRKCPAIGLAETQLAILTQEILYKFQLDGDREERIEAQYQPLLAPVIPLDIAFNSRGKSKK